VFTLAQTLTRSRKLESYFVLQNYGAATISRLLKIIGLFCRISSLLYGSFAKETCHFKEPTNRSQPTAASSERATPVLVCTCMHTHTHTPTTTRKMLQTTFLGSSALLCGVDMKEGVVSRMRAMSQMNEHRNGTTGAQNLCKSSPCQCACVYVCMLKEVWRGYD